MAEIHPSSFRDPSGFLFRRDGTLFRQVDTSFAEHYDHLLGSGLYERLVADGLLVSHTEVDESPAAPGSAHRVLRPEVIPFISYPYEWSFGQLKDAALATLQIQSMSLGHGMSLRDASAYNIQFVDGRPVLIDSLSFEKTPVGKPWVAYRQFCQHFLAPLALAAHQDARLMELLRVYIDGVPLDLASNLLGRSTRFVPGLLIHIHSHARSQRKHGSGGAPSKQGKFSERAMIGLVDSLKKVVTRLEWKEPEGSVWADYYGEAAHYSDEAMETKRRLVGEFVDSLDSVPREAWDLGGNTGAFSRIMSRRGIRTVCFDLDPAAVEINYRQIVKDSEKGLLPLVLDLTNPSPALGWANTERMSLVERGPADLGLALALIHHLAIGNNVPFPKLADFFASICRTLIIEFVPKSDPKVEHMLATREDIFDTYDIDHFEQEFSKKFSVSKKEEIGGSERTLYLMKGR